LIKPGKEKGTHHETSTNDPVLDRAVGALLGLAVGDAMGTTLEFKPRDSYPPIRGMIGGGPFGLAPGQWTDDTSMALCLADSLLHVGDLDLLDLMQRFARWQHEGYNSCTGDCFDIGNTTAAAIARFLRTGDPAAGAKEPETAGNGSLMRLAPVALRWHGQPDRAITAARAQSEATHGAPVALDACAFFAALLVEAIGGATKEQVLRDRQFPGAAEIAAIARGEWRHKHRDEIRSSGYVVHTLEAALWCVEQTESFEEAVLGAANLGEDADTTAAVAGQLAGALYGRAAMPPHWLDQLAWRDRIERIAVALCQ
jgi:ADP-ribosyl-[dinitrogen reductase] hydrolase